MHCVKCQIALLTENGVPGLTMVFVKVVLTPVVHIKKKGRGSATTPLLNSEVLIVWDQIEN
eukprot:Awhi_evm1s11087